jgi:hypothetical protein
MRQTQGEQHKIKSLIDRLYTKEKQFVYLKREDKVGSSDVIFDL